MAPMASLLESINAVMILWHIHILACFLGLAYLPFSKMFHILATPVGLVVGAVTNRDESDPANIATRKAIELDACTQCGTCSLRCSQAPAAEALNNPYILPSERMACLRRMGGDGRPGPEELDAIRQGACICSNCDRCTVVCPAGIQLRELWVSVKEDLVQSEGAEPAMLSPFSFFRGLQRDAWERMADYGGPLTKARHAVTGNGTGDHAVEEVAPLALNGPAEETEDPLLDAGHFADCFNCKNCTSVCPVVGNYADPGETLGLLPHQIMGAWAWAFGTWPPGPACCGTAPPATCARSIARRGCASRTSSTR